MEGNKSSQKKTVAVKKVRDLSGKEMEIIEPAQDIIESTSLILDGNKISSISNLEKFTHLEKLSLGHNRIVKMKGVSSAKNLRVLDLQNNTITRIEGLESLPQLEWLNLSGNSIKVIENLKSNIALRHLDLSDNCISDLGNLSQLVHLKILLFHGNMLKSLKGIPTLLPPSISVLSLADNQLEDLTEMQLVSSLPFLEQLSVMGNPCTACSIPEQTSVDYRPYILCWCKNLKNLDGLAVTHLDRQKAKVIDAEGHLKMFQPGQHLQLMGFFQKSSDIIMKDKILEETTSSQTKTSSAKGSREAWIKENSNMTSFSPLVDHRTHGKEVNDLELDDISFSWDTAGSTNTSLLDSASVYVPVVDEFPVEQTSSLSQDHHRPSTAPSASELKSITWDDLIKRDFQRHHPKKELSSNLATRSTPQLKKDSAKTQFDEKQLSGGLLMRPAIVRKNRNKSAIIPMEPKHSIQKDTRYTPILTNLIAQTFRSDSPNTSSIPSRTTIASVQCPISAITDSSHAYNLVGTSPTTVWAGDMSPIPSVHDIIRTADIIETEELEMNPGMTAGTRAHQEIENSQSLITMTKEEAVRLLHLAATMIQANFRGYLQRKRFKISISRHKAAVKIQSLWKGYRTRHLDLRAITKITKAEVTSLRRKTILLESELRKAKSESKHDKMVLSEILNILVTEIKNQRGAVERLEYERKEERRSREHMFTLYQNLQTEVIQLRKSQAERSTSLKELENSSSGVVDRRLGDIEHQHLNPVFFPYSSFKMGSNLTSSVTLHPKPCEVNHQKLCLHSLRTTNADSDIKPKGNNSVSESNIVHYSQIRTLTADGSEKEHKGPMTNNQLEKVEVGLHEKEPQNTFCNLHDIPECATRLPLILPSTCKQNCDNLEAGDTGHDDKSHAWSECNVTETSMNVQGSSRLPLFVDDSVDYESDI